MLQELLYWVSGPRTLVTGSDVLHDDGITLIKCNILPQITGSDKSSPFFFINNSIGRNYDHIFFQRRDEKKNGMLIDPDKGNLNNFTTLTG